MDAFRSLRCSAEIWESFKQETTPAEFGAMEILWEVYECRSEVVQGKGDKLQKLAESLDQMIPFDGLETKYMTWEALHAALLTVRVSIPTDSLIVGLPLSRPSNTRLSVQEEWKHSVRSEYSH